MPKKVKQPKEIFGISTNLINDYIKFVENAKIKSLIIEEHGTKIIISREKQEKVLPSGIIPVKSEEKQLQLEFKQEDKQVVAPEKPGETIEEEKYHKIVSPLTGTFYRAPAPNAPPFVKEGDNVSSGQTLCIVEAMKVMNMIKSDVNGKIVKILVENGKPVKQGDTLFLIET